MHPRRSKTAPARPHAGAWNEIRIDSARARSAGAASFPHSGHAPPGNHPACIEWTPTHSAHRPQSQHSRRETDAGAVAQRVVTGNAPGIRQDRPIIQHRITVPDQVAQLGSAPPTASTASTSAAPASTAMIATTAAMSAACILRYPAQPRQLQHRQCYGWSRPRQTG